MARHGDAFGPALPDSRHADGLHLCHIFNDDEERERTIARYLGRGIEEGELALCLVDSMSPERVRQVIAGAGHGDPADRLQTAPAAAAYCPTGEFKGTVALDAFGTLCDQAVARGFKGTRIAGDMRWAVTRGTPVDDILEYEGNVNAYVARHHATAMCEYDARLFDGGTILDLLSVHPTMMVRGQIFRNPYFVQPAEILARRRAKLSRPT